MVQQHKSFGSDDLSETGEGFFEANPMVFHTDTVTGRSATKLIRMVEMANYSGKPMSNDEIRAFRVELSEQATAELDWERAYGGLVRLEDGRVPEPSVLVSMISMGMFDGGHPAVDAIVEHPDRNVLLAISQTDLNSDQVKRLLAGAGDLAEPIQNSRAILAHFGAQAVASSV